MTGAQKRGIHNRDLLARIVRLKGSGNFTWAYIKSNLTDCPESPPQNYILNGLLQFRGIDPTDRKRGRKLWGVPGDVVTAFAGMTMQQQAGAVAG